MRLVPQLARLYMKQALQCVPFARRQVLTTSSSIPYGQDLRLLPYAEGCYIPSLISFAEVFATYATAGQAVCGNGLYIVLPYAEGFANITSSIPFCRGSATYAAAGQAAKKRPVDEQRPVG